MSRGAPRSSGGPVQGGSVHPSPSLSIAIGLEGLALGGCPLNAIDLSRTLRHRGHRVAVFAIDEKVKVSLLPYAKQAGFDVELLPSRASGPSRALQIHRFASAAQADVIHVFGPWLGPAAWTAAAFGGRRTAAVTNWTMENVSYIPAGMPMIVGTRGLQREAEITHRGPVPLMEPPVDLEADSPDPAAGSGFRRQHGVREDEVLMVTVSRLDSDLKAEGIAKAIDAVAKLDLPTLRLVIVGDGNARDTLHRRAAAANALLGRQAVILAGAMIDPRPAYDAADLTLGMGGSAIRSLAHGKPLVVLGLNGFARTFAPATIDYFYEAGFFGEEGAPDPVSHLAGEIRSLLPAARRQQLGSFGLAEVRRRFGLDAGADKLESIYRSALADVPSVTGQISRGGRTLLKMCGSEAKKVWLGGRSATAEAK